MANPRISLCVIARNESAFIGRCLTLAADAVDELVVLDTGSQDDTVAIAEGVGARVVRDVWRDDFADARNRALAASRGAWILVLDADEQLAEGSAAAIRAFVERTDVDAGMIALHNAEALDATHADVLGGARRSGSPVLLPRLFRRTDDLRWEGLIHETPQRWALARTGRFGTVQHAAIVHYGMVPSLVDLRAKAERNARLLRARAEAEPMDPSPPAYLAQELLHAGQPGEADAALAEAWRRTAARSAAGLPGLGLLRLCVVSAHRANERADDAELARVLDAADRAGMRHPNLAFHRAELLERQEEHVAAIDAYRGAIALGGVPYELEADVAASGWLAWYRAARLLLRLGRHDEADAALGASRSLASGRAEPALLHAELRMDRGQFAEALALVEPWLGDPRPDPCALAAEVALRTGLRQEALAFLRVAVARLRAGGRWIEGHRQARFSAVLKQA
jgi:glycosyltransferase involved in cell wall biosynthesis